MAVDPGAVDSLDMNREEFGNVFVSRPVNRHAEIVTVLSFKLLSQVRTIEPVLAKPVQVGELLVRQLVKFTIGTGGERFANEIVDVEHRVGDILYRRQPSSPTGLRRVAGVNAFRSNPNH